MQSNIYQNMKKKHKYNQNSVIRGALRRAFARSPFVQEIMNESRREVPRYTKDGNRHKKNWVQRQCQVCQEWTSSSRMAVDHIVPVISVDDGFQDWNEFIARLWCDKSNLQRICDECHDKKTYKERIERLTKQYTLELDEIETLLKSFTGPYKVEAAVFQTVLKEHKKILAKYIAKKKTIGLEPIVQRALMLKENLLKGIYNV